MRLRNIFSARSKDGAPRWHLVYFALAGFDLLTVGLSLSLTHNLMTIHEQSVQTSRQWAVRLGAITELSDLAQAANAPGNDVFDNGDVTTARTLRNAAVTTFDARLALVASELNADVASSERHDVALALSDARQAMTAMNAESELIFRHFEAGNRRAAGQRMASMDRTYARVTRSISQAINAVQQVQSAYLSHQVERRPVRGIDTLFFHVRDTGIGLSGEQLTGLFQPFAQANSEISREYGGTGLGLAPTRRLAQLLGGDVEVTSELGKGSTFTLHVLAILHDPAAADAAEARSDGPLVLIIDDEPAARDLSKRALGRAGLATLGAATAAEGLALARKRAPALILLDICLPDRSGWAVLEALKRAPETAAIPVIVLSIIDDRARALAGGAAEHILKPADRTKLVATIMRYARARPAAKAEPAQRQLRIAG